MKLDRKTHFQIQMHFWLFVGLVLLLASLAIALTRSHHQTWDVTLGGRNSVSEGSVAQLRKLSGPVTITAYADPGSRVGDVLKRFFAPYQRIRPDIQLRFVNPDEHPDLARQAGVQQPGESVVQYGKRSDRLSSFNESAFINLLARLARDQDRLVLYLDGHGERKLDGVANHDLGDFGKQLASRGFNSAPLNLSLAQEVPRNAALLVIAGPRIDLLPAELAKLKDYVQRGGNLLWLVDTEPLHGLQALTEQLGIALTSGTVIDPQGKELGSEASMAVGALYGQHPILQNFNLLTVFPFAREVLPVENDGGWSATPLIQVAAQGWLETGTLDASAKFDKGRDKIGPITIAVALQRNVNDRTQRVVVIGNGHFLANQFLGNGGNLDLGLNCVNWLSGDERLINIQPRPTQDAQVLLSERAKITLFLGYLVILPLGLIATGVWVWWRRRQA